jgi:hypothetical protein
MPPADRLPSETQGKAFVPSCCKQKCGWFESWCYTLRILHNCILMPMSWTLRASSWTNTQHVSLLHEGSVHGMWHYTPFFIFTNNCFFIWYTSDNVLFNYINSHDYIVLVTGDKNEYWALVEWYWQGKTEVLGEILSLYHLGHHKSHVNWPGIELGL